MAKSKELEGTRTLLNKSIKEFIYDLAPRIDLDADYQREKIWSSKQQQLLLDSIIRDIDIPKIYLVEVKNNDQFDLECIDGKQRMTTLLQFFNPDSDEDSSINVRFYEKEYSYKSLKKEHPSVAKKIEDYKLTFTVYRPLDDEYVREIFRRLQLGLRLNSGELLKSRTGTIRDFIFKEIGNNGPFLRRTSLSDKRASRPFTMSQICLNSFARAKDERFARARLQDIEDFFETYHDLDSEDENLVRIKKVLKLMDSEFGERASIISSRAIAVSGYLFFEELALGSDRSKISEFPNFYVELLNEIKDNMEKITKFHSPKNSRVMDRFQRYVLQASVEPYSIERRHTFLQEAFQHYLSTDGEILGRPD